MKSFRTRPFALLLAVAATFTVARDAAAEEGVAVGAGVVAEPAPYSPEVVAKADQVLAEFGLRRSGRSIGAVEAGEIQRLLLGLAKPRKSLRGLADALALSEQQLAAAEMEFRVADAQNAQWNLQLAQPGIDVRTNNRIVGLINANQTRLRQLNDLQDSLRMTIQQRRKELADAEASYAEVVLAARQDLKRLRETLQPLIDHPQLAIALKVHATNHQTPPTVDLESLLGTVDRKLSQIEAEIFRETIPLEVSSVGALSVNVGINDQNIPMLLDSGAALTVLPADLARRLGVTVPADASPVRLVLADGKALMARSAVIPTVRVGGFEAEKVAAAVLDPGSAITHPLLGMSFLGKFKFEIDSAAKELRLLRVAND